LLDNLTEFFGFKKKPKKKPTIKDYHIPRLIDGQWWYGYEKVYIKRYPACTFPLNNDRMDTSNTENSNE